MWEQIVSNRRRSALVVGSMGVLLVLTGIAVALALGGDANPGAVLVGAAVSLGLWFLLWLVAVKDGDRMLLRVAGARPLSRQDHLQLHNVVEEMTIAAALPRMPAVYLIDDPSPNAFATGQGPEKSAVAVTTGLLTLLNRDELQGVVAHELAHVKNRDVRLITVAGVMVGTIVLLAEFARRILWHGGSMRRRSRSSGKDGGAQVVVIAIALVFLMLAPVLAQLMYFSLSRRREYLADASGARFTRYPEGLASALEKIGKSGRPLADQSRVTAPMYIAHPRQAAGHAASAYSTHPPLAERIRILRAMGGTPTYAAYEAAYHRLRKKHLIGTRSLTEDAAKPTAAATPASAPAAASSSVAAATPTAAGAHAPSPAFSSATGDTAADLRLRAREASDAFLLASGYQRRTCRCGATVKIPPALIGRFSSCPRCGTAFPRD